MPDDLVVPPEPTEPDVAAEVLEPGVAGASARRIDDQRKTKREKGIRDVGPALGDPPVEGVKRQVAVVSDMVTGDALGPVRVRGFLCVVNADWPIFDGDVTIDGVEALWAKGLLGIAAAAGPLTDANVEQMTRRPATGVAPA